MRGIRASLTRRPRSFGTMSDVKSIPSRTVRSLTRRVRSRTHRRRCRRTAPRRPRARFIGDFFSAALHDSASSASMSRTNVSESFPAMKSRARNAESPAISCENFTFRAHSFRKLCRNTRFEVVLFTGGSTPGKAINSPSENWPSPRGSGVGIAHRAMKR